MPKSSSSNESYGLPLHTIETLKTVFQRHPKIEKVILYGSRAKGNYRTGSDIDLCLLAPSLSFNEMLTIENELDDLLLPWKIDLSLKHTIDNPDLLTHIEKVGIIFFIRSLHG